MPNHLPEPLQPSSYKQATLNGVRLMLSDGSINYTTTRQYTTYALTLPTIPKHRVLHAPGTTEIAVSLSGDYTLESASAFNNLLNPSNRGTLHTLAIQPYIIAAGNAATTPVLFSNCLYFESLSLTAAVGSHVRYSMVFKSIADWAPIAPFVIPSIPFVYPIPGSATGVIGATTLTAWTLQHTQALTASWLNHPTLRLPVYYRAGDTSTTLNFTTYKNPLMSDQVFTGAVNLTIANAIVTEVAYQYGGDTPTFTATVTDVSVANNPTESYLSLAGGPAAPSGWL